MDHNAKDGRRCRENMNNEREKGQNTYGTIERTTDDTLYYRCITKSYTLG